MYSIYFQVIIDDKPWLSWSIMSKDLNMISYLCRRRQKDVADYIITDEKLSHELMNLLLSSDSTRYTTYMSRYIHILDNIALLLNLLLLFLMLMTLKNIFF